MEWQRPEALFLILPVLLAWLGLALFARSRRRRAARAFVDAAMAPRILPTESAGRFWLKLLCMELALVCGLIAIAGPRFGLYYEQIKPRGSDIYVMIDVSRSMLAEDVPPNRLGRAKSDVSSLLNRLNGERVGLIAFAGKAVVKCPLTTDYGFFRLALNDLDPNSAPRGGTAIGDAIRKGLEVFPTEAERDRAIILITDGDDQESYPMEAAAQAAERRVLVFTVGLGDSSQGSRVPETRDGKLTFMEHDGQQVWSKLNHGLLKDIALKTRGAYIPAGTKAYDLGQLYQDHLRSLKGGEGSQTQRTRRHERFQLFLGLSLFFLILDILIKPYAQAATASAPARNSNGRAALAALLAFCFLPLANAGDANRALGEGMEAYKKDDFDKAVEKFSAATEALKNAETEELSAIAAFNLACAYQRKGDTANARDQYLKAGLAKDKKIAAEAHYNLGVLSADAARAAAGEKPEEVPPEKREEILKSLKDAVGSFRQALNAKKDHTEARKNLELVLQWIKVYSDKWREFDRMKRREQLNLPQFLDFMINAEKALRAGTRALPENARRDAFAELKRAQDELEEEIPWLNRKIKSEFDAMQKQSSQPGQKVGSVTDTKQIDDAVKMLQDWSEASGKLMKAASDKLQERQPKPAAVAQLQAVQELERIWETIVPFQPLLQRALADQTTITKTLKPDSMPTPAPVAPPLAPPVKPTLTNDPTMAEDVAQLQDDTLRRTSLLKFKAESELQQVEQQKAQPQAPTPPPQPGQPAAPQQPDPEKVKEGLKKAIELAPKAVEKERIALKFLKQQDFERAYPDAEEARKILEEIAKAQPPDPKQDQDQKNKDQQNKDQQQKQDQKDKDKDKKDEQKKDEQNIDKDQEKKDEKKEEQQKAEKVPLNKDQLEDILRRVREREKSKMERDKKQKAILMGPGSVDKDW